MTVGGRTASPRDSARPWDDAPCGYLVTTDDGHVVDANRHMVKILGFTRDQLRTMRFVEMLVPGARFYHETHFVPVLRMHGEIAGLALDLRHRDGGRVPVLVNARRVEAADGSGVRVHVVAFDARTRREWEQELLRAKERAEASESRAIALSRTLQATLMPPLTPMIPGMEIATAYRPAGDGDEVGGDFYDIFQVAENDWVITIGDVEGKGIQAAAVTALARHVLRASSVRSRSPRDALLTLNDVLLGSDTTRLLTAVAILLSVRDGRWTALSACGGHTPPALLRGGTSQEMSPLGTLLGATPRPHIQEQLVELRRDDVIFVSTDGIPEARSPFTGEFYDEQRAAAILRDHAGSVHDMVDMLVRDVLTFSDNRTRDDIAVVAARVTS